MARKLNRRASGGRHLQWALEIQATMEAHLAINDTFTEGQRQALEAEAAVLSERIEALGEAVEVYQTFLNTAYRAIRSKQRVADFLCDKAMIETQARLKPRQVDINDILPGGFARIFSGLSLSRILNSGTETTVTLVRTASQIIESLPERIQGRAEIAERLKVVSDLLDGFNTERADTIDPRRAPLRLAVEKATFDLREALEQIDGRLRTPFGRAFIDSLYPDLRRRPNRSEDDQDPLLEDNSDDPTP